MFLYVAAAPTRPELGKEVSMATKESERRMSEAGKRLKKIEAIIGELESHPKPLFERPSRMEWVPCDSAPAQRRARVGWQTGT